MLRWGPAATDVVVAQIVGVSAALGLALVGLGPIGAIPVGVAIAGAAMVPVDGRRLRWWVASAVIHLRGRASAASRPMVDAVFDHRDDHRVIGMRQHSTRLSAVIEVVPLRSGFTVFDAGLTHPDALLPLDALAGCLRRSDLAPIELDITTHGRRRAAQAPTDVAEAYRRLIGPLPAIATRSVYVTVTLDTAVVGLACDRRGPGLGGAAAALTVCVGRIERVLAGARLHARVLDVSDFPGLDRDISGGLPPSVISPGWSALHSGRSTWRARALRSVSTADVNAVWAGTSEEMTLTVRLRSATVGEAAKTCASAVVTDLHSTAEITPRRAATASLSGRLHRAMFTAVPGRTSGGDALAPTQPVEPSTLVVPAAGCGQLLGADPDGKAVTARIWGPGRTVTHLAGELFLARQVVLRAVATGASVEVVSDRPDQWRHLVQIVGDQRQMVVSPAPGPARDLLVVDGAVSVPPAVRATLYVADHIDRLPAGEPDLIVSQPAGAGEYLEVITDQGAIPLTMITIAHETALIGRPRVPLQEGTSQPR